MNFAFDFFYSGDNNITRTIQDMSDQLFRPLSEDLRLWFDEIADLAKTPEDAEIPAADRVVALDHNSRGYTEAIQKIADLEEALRASNAIDSDEKARVKAEIESGKILLAAPRTRLGAVKAVLFASVVWIADNFAGGALGEIAGAAARAIATLLGFPL
ncbi:MAG: hypothetical protein V4753_14690 [Pseudomonadota bacterium]